MYVNTPTLLSIGLLSDLPVLCEQISKHSENLDDYICTDSYFLFFLSVAISKQIGTNRKIKLLTANCT